MARNRTKTAEKIDTFMERASEALGAGRFFECEVVATDALELAYRAEDFDRMARILLPLEEARRQKRLAAADTKRVVRVDDYEILERPIEAGCYLIEPMLVGADGRDLRERANEAEIPVIVIVREPETTTKLWPIVMIGPVTVRTRVRPPSKVDPAWFIEASEALGEEAIEQVDPDAAVATRIDHLLQRLQTVQDHDRLHQVLMEACKAAVEANAGDAASSGSGAKAAKSAK